MAKAIGYVIEDGTKNEVGFSLTGTNTVVDNNWTNITNFGELLDGTKIRYAKKYDPVILDAGGRIRKGSTVVASYGNATVSTPGVVASDLGSPLAVDVDGIHEPITQVAAGSATGVHAAITLSTVSQTIASGITNPSGRFVTIVGNDTDMLGTVTVVGTAEDDSVISQGLALNGTTTVTSTLIYKTVTSVTVPPYTVDGSETVSVGTGLKATKAGITNPDVARTITATGNASGNSGNVVITGSYKGTVQTSTLALSGTSTIESTHIYDKVTQIQLPTETHSGTDNVQIGFGDKIGLGAILVRPTVFMTIENVTPIGLGADTTFTQHTDATDETLNYITFANASDGTTRRVYHVQE